MEEKEIKKGLIGILYNKENEGFVHEDDAYNIANKMYEEWGENRAKDFLAAYEKDREPFKEFKRECIKHYMTGVIAITPRFIINSAYPTVLKYMELNLRENNYNVIKLLEEEKKMNEETREKTKTTDELS